MPAGVLTTAKLTPEYQARLEKRVADVKRGIEWDPISTCAPPGHPRWLTEPFLREFVPTPDQTWLINEMVNDIRRVYTDGRDHVPAEDRYPLYNGDSIGFWDGGRLVVHTNQLQGGIYQRSNPDYTDQVETVEIWQRDGDTITADVWVYDPPALAEPWYVKQVYGKLRPEAGPPHPLLELRREPEQRGAPDAGRHDAVQRLHLRPEGGEEVRGSHAQTAGAGGRGARDGRRDAPPRRGLAHHSAAMFDEKKTVTVEGEVKEFQFTNPHSWLLVDVKDKDGKVTTWGFEAEGPSTLARAGIRPSDFKAGTRLKITGNPMKDGRPAAIWVSAVRADGKAFNPRAGFVVR